MNGGSEQFEKGALFFRIAMSLGVLEKFMVYRVRWEEDAHRSYVDETVMSLALLDAGTGFVVATTDTETERRGQRRTLLTTLYGSCPASCCSQHIIVVVETSEICACCGFR